MASPRSHAPGPAPRRPANPTFCFPQAAGAAAPRPPRPTGPLNLLEQDTPRTPPGAVGDVATRVSRALLPPRVNHSALEEAAPLGPARQVLSCE